MSKLVVDSSVALKWFVDEVDDQKARRLLADSVIGSLSLLAPALIYTEVANILWKKHRQGVLTANQARQKMAELQSVHLAISTDAALLDDALRLAMQHHRSVYDSLYLALSLREDCPFVTADEKLVNAIRNTYPNARLLSALS